MNVAVICEDFSNLAMASFIEDILELALYDNKVEGCFSGKDVVNGTDRERERLDSAFPKSGRNPDVFIIWDPDTNPGGWARKLKKYLWECFPESTLIWVGLAENFSGYLDDLNQPENGSFLVDYSDPTGSLSRWLKNGLLKKSESEKEATTKLFSKFLDTPSGPLHFLIVIRKIIG